MKQFKINPLSKDELAIWFKNKTINPRTNRKIKENGPSYKYIEKMYYKMNLPFDKYSNFRKNKIDPILNQKLPILKKHKYFKFPYIWDPYTGIKSNVKDINGPLCFDPDSLIYFFYLNSLNHLWTDDNNNFTGHFGDAVGNGPDFFIPGRGFHKDWYLFRLPIIDGYLKQEDWNQVVTLGPILTFNDIKDIYSIAQTYNNFEKRFGIKRPNLLLIYNLYHQAIDKSPKLNISKELEFNLDPETRNEMITFINRKAVQDLKNI